MAGADTGIYVVPALGGPERKLLSTRMPARFGADILHLSVGRRTASGSPSAMCCQEKRTSYVGSISSPRKHWRPSRFRISPKCLGEGLPAFSHNGEYLAYWCFRSERSEAVLYSLPIRGGQPKTISPFRAFPNGLTWSADDKKLIYSLNSLEVGSPMNSVKLLSRMGRRNSLPSQEVQCCPQFRPRATNLPTALFPPTSNIWRRDLLHPESPAVELIPSSRAQFDAQYSPDGKRIAFASARSGMQGVWISNDDGSNLVQISNPTLCEWQPAMVAGRKQDSV